MINLRFAPEFAEDLKAKVQMPGVKLFLAEALGAFQADLQARPDRFLRHLQQNGRGLMLALEKHGKVQITRGESQKLVPRYFVRFLNAPEFIFVATCDAPDDFYAEGVVPSLSFTAVVSLAQEMARMSQGAQPKNDQRM